MYKFDDITLLVTHYNRSKSLRNLLETFSKLKISFGNIIVSDDASNQVHLKSLKKLKEEFNFDLLNTPTNKGLGNNINKGQDAVKTPYTLYIQEDFIPKEKFGEKLNLAFQFMQKNADLDLVRFYAYFKYPHLRDIKEGFGEVIFKFYKIWQGYRKFYVYSDHPHLRRSNFFERFGRYAEGIKSDRTEYKMMMQVLSKKPRVYFYEHITELIDQENTVEEPSTVKRNFWRNNNSFLINGLREIYRYLRFNTDLLIYKLKG
ncbi:glycosyltransferase [Pedobacter sp. SD-b]|uniref:Glycosyltransferase n=1 Tax=Pedobacter segetis TaxID=2793069 RepID=A0ABS1BFT7_9SPHI|nr:glycosyltransferase [Pedobacter segetis]MBK0381723.1 glycosyltransferase [Pedobacter segetis]